MRLKTLFAGLMVLYGTAALAASPNGASDGVAGKPDHAADPALSARFEQALDQLFMMSPEQIRTFQERERGTEAVIHADPHVEVINTQRRLSLEPGTPIPEVEVAPGHTASIVLLDVTGQPWPIVHSNLGDQTRFRVVRPEQGAQNVIEVGTDHPGGRSTLTLLLSEIPTPVVFKLVARPDRHEAVSSFTVEGRGPNATLPPVGRRGVDSLADPVLLGFLDRVPPDGAAPVRLEGAPGALAWRYQGHLYLRTTAALLWPAYTGIQAGPGELRVYELPDQPSLLLSVNGAGANVMVEAP